MHIEISAEESIAKRFYAALVAQAPVQAVITHHSIVPTAYSAFTRFEIRQSAASNSPSLPITPDFALCSSCREELQDTSNRRHLYPFTTCTVCGPRYSITDGMPYDREATAMRAFTMCPVCKAEYDDIENRRFHSQTNSCSACGIKMSMFAGDGAMFASGQKTILDAIQQQLAAGKIIAVKAIGGYLLLCDATNALVVQLLRQRKQRPAKPFALLFAEPAQLEQYAILYDKEKTCLSSAVAPVVLLKSKQGTSLALNEIAPSLTTIGAMMPSAPLLQIIAQQFGKPLIATSANISNNPIIFRDEDALEQLSAVADYIVSHNRDILTPQDDSVIQFTRLGGRQIVFRRSRGMAPSFLAYRTVQQEHVLATGAFMKSSFTLQANSQTFISQYLGNTATVEAQLSYKAALAHAMKLLQLRPRVIITDKHPGYFSYQLAQQLSGVYDCTAKEVQHHKAHFAAVLAENHLLQARDPVLGVIWDGTGLGDDGQVWGGEFFVYHHQYMQRTSHFGYFPQLLNDKMAREPRLSALAVCAGIEKADTLLAHKFTGTEWQLYKRMLLQAPQLQCSSMGRIFDAVASLLNVCNKQSYEGEAALLLQELAATYTDKNGYQIGECYFLPELFDKELSTAALFAAIVEDVLLQKEPAFIAAKFHYSLVKLIAMLADHLGIRQIAFSGGVFQNALLVDMTDELLSPGYSLFFHQQLSPNDENISFGQMVYCDNDIDGIRSMAATAVMHEKDTVASQ